MRTGSRGRFGALFAGMLLLAGPMPALRAAEPVTAESDADLARLGVAHDGASERLVRGVRVLLRIRRQAASGGQGEIGRYRDAVDGYAQFLKRDNLALAREALRRARVSYERIDRVWLNRMAARLDNQADAGDLSPRDAAKLAETIALTKEIAAGLAQINDLAGERRRFESEMDRSFRNLVRLREEARRIRDEIAPLSPPAAVLLLFEEIEAAYATELRPLRVREEGLRSLHGRLEDRFIEGGRGADLQEIRSALGKVRALERAFASSPDRRNG
ncbi:MAG: hypothetical protein ACKVU1_09565 [bacterium]